MVHVFLAGEGMSDYKTGIQQVNSYYLVLLTVYCKQPTNSFKGDTVCWIKY